MKRVYTNDNIVVVQNVRNVLALSSIESFVKNEHTVPVGAQHGINNIFHELWILNDEDYKKASAIIENEIENPRSQASWICSNCNEDNEGSFEICWKCQEEPSSTERIQA